MTENIDKVGGEGTGAFAKQVIDIYTKNYEKHKIAAEERNSSAAF